MRAALARHDALLRHCIGAHDGHVFKTVGDAFCAAFHTASDALAAALDAQRALHRERWPEAAKLRVRMALHTGAVEVRDGDYFGAPLNRVARLLAAGHGGQTLLSESTHDLCRDHLPPLASVKALGEHGLKDLARREAVFQLCHPDLPQSFPPLKSTARAARQGHAVDRRAAVRQHEPRRGERYFADGLAEELLNVLAKIRGLRVASRTSAFSFKGKDVDIPTVAQKLNVATMLEGSVRKSGKRVRITAQLIQVATDSHLWSETYDRELDDIFAVQDDIAQSVVKELRAALLGEGLGAVGDAAGEGRSAGGGDGAQRQSRGLPALPAGAYFIERMTQADLTRGSTTSSRRSRSIRTSRWRGRACRGPTQTQAGYGWAPVTEGFERAREAAQARARARAGSGRRSHLLGHGLEGYDWDWTAADAVPARVGARARRRARAARCRGMARIFGGRTTRHRAAAQGRGARPVEHVRSRFLGLRCAVRAASTRRRRRSPRST